MCQGKKEEDRSGGGWMTPATAFRKELSGEEAQDRVQWMRLIINRNSVKVGKDAEEEYNLNMSGMIAHHMYTTVMSTYSNRKI